MKTKIYCVSVSCDSDISFPNKSKPYHNAIHISRLRDGIIRTGVYDISTSARHKRSLRIAQVLREKTE